MPAGVVAGSRPKVRVQHAARRERIHAAGWRRGDGGARRAVLQVTHIAGLAHLVRLAAADGDEDAVAGVLYVRPAQRGDFKPPRPLNRPARDGETRRRLAAGESVRVLCCGLVTVQLARLA